MADSRWQRRGYSAFAGLCQAGVAENVGHLKTGQFEPAAEIFCLNAKTERAFYSAAVSFQVAFGLPENNGHTQGAIMLTSRRYGLCLAATLWLAGCFELDPLTHQSWQEEVKLSDGTVILVERRLAVREGGFLPESDDKILKNEVEVLDAKGLPPPPVWSDKWKPMVLDRDEHGVWFMVVIPRHCFDWDHDLLYGQYKAINGVWQKVEFDMNLNLRRPNIEWYIKKEMPEMLRLRDKPEWEEGGGGTAPEYRIINTSYRSGC